MTIILLTIDRLLQTFSMIYFMTIVACGYSFHLPTKIDTFAVVSSISVSKVIVLGSPWLLRDMIMDTLNKEQHLFIRFWSQLSICLNQTYFMRSVTDIDRTRKWNEARMVQYFMSNVFVFIWVRFNFDRNSWKVLFTVCGAWFTSECIAYILKIFLIQFAQWCR